MNLDATFNSFIGYGQVALFSVTGIDYDTQKSTYDYVVMLVNLTPYLIMWTAISVLAVIAIILFVALFTLVSIPVILIAVVVFLFAILLGFLAAANIFVFYISFIPVTGPLSLITTLGYIIF